MVKKKEEEIDQNDLPQMERLIIKLNHNLPKDFTIKQNESIQNLNQYNVYFITKEDIIQKAIENKLYIDPNTLTDKQKKDIDNLPTILTEKILSNSYDIIIKEKELEIRKIKYFKLKEELENNNIPESKKKKEKEEDIINIEEILNSEKILFLLTNFPFLEEEYYGLEFSKEKPLDILFNINYEINEISLTNSEKESSKKSNSKENHILTKSNLKKYIYNEKEKNELENYNINKNILKKSLKKMNTENYCYNIINKNLELQINTKDLENSLKYNSKNILEKVNSYFNELIEFKNWQKNKNKKKFNKEIINKNELKNIYKKVKNKNKNLNIFELFNNTIEYYNIWTENCKNKENDVINDKLKYNILEEKINTIDDLFNDFDNNIEIKENNIIKNVIIPDMNIPGINRYKMPKIPIKSKDLRIKEISEYIPLYNCNQIEIQEKLDILNFEKNILEKNNYFNQNLLDKTILKYLNVEEFKSDYLKSLKMNNEIITEYNSISDSLIIYMKNHQKLFNKGLLYENIPWSIYPNRSNWFKYFKNNEINLSKIDFYDLQCEKISNLDEKIEYIYCGDDTVIQLSNKTINDNIIFQNLFKNNNLEFGFKLPNDSILNKYQLIHQYEVESSETPIEEEDKNKKKKKGKNEVEDIIPKTTKIITEYDTIERKNEGEFWLYDSNNLKIFTTFERNFNKEIYDNINNFDEILINKYGIQNKSKYLMTTNFIISNNNLVKLLNNGDIFLKSNFYNNEKYRVINRNGTITKYLNNGKIKILSYNGNICESEGNNLWICTNNKGIRWEENIITKEIRELEPLLLTKKSESAEKEYPEVWLREDNLLTINYQNNNYLIIDEDKSKIYFNKEENELFLEHPKYESIKIYFGNVKLENIKKLKNNHIKIYLEEGSIINSYIDDKNKIYSFVDTNQGNLLYFDNKDEIVIIPFNNRVNLDKLNKELDISKLKIDLLVKYIENQIIEIQISEKISNKKGNKGKNSKIKHQKDALNEILQSLKLKFINDLTNVDNNIIDSNNESLENNDISYKNINLSNRSIEDNLDEFKYLFELNKHHENIKQEILDKIDRSNDFYYNQIICNNINDRNYGIYSINLKEKKLYTKNNFNLNIQYDNYNNILIEELNENHIEELINKLKNEYNDDKSSKSSKHLSQNENRLKDIFDEQKHLIYNYKPNNNLYLIEDNKIKKYIGLNEYKSIENIMYILGFEINNEIEILNNYGTVNSYYIKEKDLQNELKKELITEKIPLNNLIPNLNYEKYISELNKYDKIVNYFIRKNDIKNNKLLEIYDYYKNDKNIINYKELDNYELLKHIKNNYNNKIISIENRQKDVHEIDEEYLIDLSTNVYENYLNDYYKLQHHKEESIKRNLIKSIKQIDNNKIPFKKQQDCINEIINSKEKHYKKKLKEKKIFETCNRFLNSYFLTIKGKTFIDNKPEDDPPKKLTEDDKNILNELALLGERDIYENINIEINENIDENIEINEIKKTNSEVEENIPEYINKPFISINKLMKYEEDKIKIEEEKKAKTFFEIRRKEYNVYGDKRKKLPEIKILYNTNPLEELNSKYIEINASTDIRVRTASNARKINILAPNTGELRNNGNHHILMKSLDKGNTDLGIKQNLMKIGANNDILQKGLIIYPEKIDFGNIKRNKIFKTKIIIRNEDNLTQNIFIKNNNPEIKIIMNLNKIIYKNNKIHSIVKLNKSIAPGMMRELILGFNSSNISKKLFKEEFQIFTKYKIYTIPISAMIIEDELNNTKSSFKIKNIKHLSNNIKEINEKEFKYLGEPNINSTFHNNNIEITKTLDSEYIPRNNFDKNNNLSSFKD